MGTVTCVDSRGTHLTYGAVYKVLGESSNGFLTVEDAKGNIGTYNKNRFETNYDYVVTLNTIKDKEPDEEEPDEELDEVEQDVTLYSVVYSIDYAGGIKLSECRDIVKIVGNIVTPITKLHGQVAIDTDKGLVVIPYESIIHLHPQF